MIPVVVLDKVGTLVNESTRSTPNPRELGEFISQVTHTTTSEITLIEWKLTGLEVPVGLSISDKGLISGIMDIFDNQTAIKNNTTPEVTDVSGQNWMSNGRYRGSSYTFNFQIELVYEYELVATVSEDAEEGSEPPTPKIVRDVVSSDVNITMVRNYDVDNYVFVKKYLEAGHKLIYDNEEYNISSIGDYLNKHPGPFGSTKR